MSATTQENTFQGEGGEGEGFTHWDPACHMHAHTSLPIYVLAQHCMKIQHFYPLPISLSLLILYPRQHIMPSQGKHVDKHPFFSTKMKKQGKDANQNWLWIGNILKCTWAWISADHACKVQNTITQNYAVCKTSQKNTEVNFLEKEHCPSFDLPTEYPSKLLKNSIA